MATATIAGTITLPNSSGGSNTSVIIGSPSITTASTTGPTLTFTEKSSNTFVVAVGSPLTVPLGTIASSDILYIGSDAAVSIVLNTGTFTIAAGGFIMLYMAGITVAPVITATPVDANVEIILAGA